MNNTIPTTSLNRLNLLKDDSTRHQVMTHLLTHPKYKFRVEHEYISRQSSVITTVTCFEQEYIYIKVTETDSIPYDPNKPFMFKDRDGYQVFVYFELVD